MQMNLINMQHKYMKKTLGKNQIQGTLGKSHQKKSQIMSYSQRDFLVSLLVSLGSVGDLPIQGAHSFLKSQGFCGTKDPTIFSLKMLKVYFLTSLEKLSRQSLGFLPTLGMTFNGKCLTARASEFHKIGKGYSLSDILEPYPDQKYFLSEEQTRKLLSTLRGGGINKWLKGGKNQSRNNSQGQRVYATSGVATTQSAQGGGWGAKTGLYIIGMPRKHSRMRDGDFCTLDANYYKGLANQERPAVAVAWSKSQERPAVAVAWSKSQERPAVAVAWSKSHRTGKSESDRKRKNYGEIEERLKIGEFNTINTGEGGKSQSTQNFVSCAVGIRRLTPTECARLQGFPDDWHGGVSDARAYKAYGNAVTVNVVEEIGKVLLREINGKNTKK